MHHVDGAVDLDRIEALAGLEEDDQLLEEGGHPFCTVPIDGDLVPPDGDTGAVECPFDQPQQLVALAEEAGHEMVAGNENLDLGACHVRSGSDPTSGSGAADPIPSHPGPNEPGRGRPRPDAAVLSRGASRRPGHRAGGGGGGPRSSAHRAPR